ncbi:MULTISPECIES: type II and III secretion system protein family protein [unclassified Novosphingobium]|uniref:type II and III secretion system protein family protein n=1 Tax=unclassified Novosphingobium TaxID=2644732 RepID=UPI00146CD87B|nr:MULTISPECIES: type II and III secretion system protein family protein [unclassified Novosphingobium]NMN03236.1 pilus assembly protein CpaC [Novosphingobium sp. SG919]NMN86774.1 pilus assembly protein CpaC [Novosphingobium sp. SG916]
MSTAFSIRQPVASKGQSMTNRISSALLTAMVVATPLALVAGAQAAHAQSVTSPARSIAVGLGRGELVTLPSRMADVFVADDKIADVQVKSTNQLYVFGKGPGETTVYASNAKGDVIWSANVRVGTNIDSVDQMLHLAMPDAKIQAATMNSTVLLTGTVTAPEDAAEAERLVKAFVGDKMQVISRLKMATPLQVMLQVRIAEVSRTLTRAIGMNWASADTTSGMKFGIGQGTAATQYVAGGPLITGMNTALTTTTTVSPSATTGTRLTLNGKLFGLDVLGALDLGETIGLANTLAEPNLTALSGETAEFLAGGEFPIPLSQGLGTTSIEYKKYGVSLAYTPTVLANGRISLRVRPEVSELSSDGSITISGYSIPGLKVRRAETTVELGSGQSFMIAGLLSNSAQNTITKLPGAGDLPILGSLFRSTSFKKGETELVIVVTPFLVSPVNDPKDIKLPTDGFRAADALQQVLGNQESKPSNGETRPMPTEKEGTVQATPAAPKVGDASGAQGGKNRQASADVKPGFSL